LMLTKAPFGIFTLDIFKDISLPSFLFDSLAVVVAVIAFSSLKSSFWTLHNETISGESEAPQEVFIAAP